MKLILIVLLSPLLLQCSADNRTENYIAGFDISHDDKYVLFAYGNTDSCSIYRMALDNGIIDTILSDGNVYVDPQFSKNDDEILCVKNIETDSGSLCLLKSDKNIKNLLTLPGVITEAVFADNDSTIIFCWAKEYKNYSPMAAKMPHGMDIYEYTIFTGKLIALTHYNAYSLGNISVFGDSVFYSSYDTGLCLLDKKSLQISSINPLNNPRKSVDMYYSPMLSSKNNSIFFIAPYELYTMDLKTRTGSLIARSDYDHYRHVKLFRGRDNIMFTLEGPSDSLYSIDFKGENYKKYPIEFKR